MEYNNSPKKFEFGLLRGRIIFFKWTSGQNKVDDRGPEGQLLSKICQGPKSKSKGPKDPLKIKFYFNLHSVRYESK